MTNCGHPLCGLPVAACPDAATDGGCWLPGCAGWLHKRSGAHMGLDCHPATPDAAAARPRPGTAVPGEAAAVREGKDPALPAVLPAAFPRGGGGAATRQERQQEQLEKWRRAESAKGHKDRNQRHIPAAKRHGPFGAASGVRIPPPGGQR
jgi:hypothetical protein